MTLIGAMGPKGLKERGESRGRLGVEVFLKF